MGAVGKADSPLVFAQLPDVSSASFSFSSAFSALVRSSSAFCRFRHLPLLFRLPVLFLYADMLYVLK